MTRHVVKLVKLCDCGREVASNEIATLSETDMNMYCGPEASAPGQLPAFGIASSAMLYATDVHRRNAQAVGMCRRDECDVCVAARVNR